MTPTMMGAGVIVVVIVAVLVRVLIRRRRPRSTPDGGRYTPDPNSDFARLLNSGEPRPASTPAPATRPSPPPPKSSAKSASALLVTVRRLQAAHAGWTEILAAINPHADGTTARLLTSLRGPHQFAPQVALNAIEDGCQRVLASNASASAAEALKEALSRSQVVTGLGD
jgi:hypothetical protein